MRKLRLSPRVTMYVCTGCKLHKRVWLRVSVGTGILPAFCLPVLGRLVQAVSANRGYPFLMSTEVLDGWR